MADAGNHRIEKFPPSGEFLLMFGREVNKTAVETAAAAPKRTSARRLGIRATYARTASLPKPRGRSSRPNYLAVDNNCALHEPPLTATTTPTCEAFDPSSGDVYVADPGDALVSKFLASGELDKAWGTEGQKNGADASLPKFPALYGIAVGGPKAISSSARPTPNSAASTRCSTPRTAQSSRAYYNPPGAYFLKVGPSGAFYAGEPYALERPANELYKNTGSVIEHYPTLEPTEAADSFGSGDLFGAMGISVNHRVPCGLRRQLEQQRRRRLRRRPADRHDRALHEASESEVTLTGQIDPAGRGAITACHFEYGFDKSYGTTVPCTPDPDSALRSNSPGPPK